MFSKESLETLRQRVDLSELIGAYVPLKRFGTVFKACCPFHEEKTPSFGVARGDHHYHCFGCGAHGDAIAFLMQFLRIGFREAVEMLAQRYQVPLQMEEKEEAGIPKKRLKECLERVTQLTHAALLRSSVGEGALEYLFQRGLPLDFLSAFQIGYWPRDGWLLQQLRSMNFQEEELQMAGLLASSGRPLFSDRITIPIRNVSGEVIGFSARKWQENTHGGKYVNSPETPLFKKSHLLFGLNYSRRRIAKERAVLLVEGQLDALSMIFSGINLTVAAQGTAFGEGHLKELLNLGVQRAWVVFDQDSAGVEGALKVGQLLQREGIGVRVVSLPSKSDPDEILKSHGPEEMLKYLDHAPDYLSYLVDYHREKEPIKDPATTSQIASSIVRQIQEWKHPVMIHEALKQLAKKLGIPEHLLGIVRAPPKVSSKVARQIAMKMETSQELEADFLRWCLWVGGEHPELLQQCFSVLSSNYFHHLQARSLFEAIQMLLQQGKIFDWLSLAAEALEESTLQWIDELLKKKMPLEKAKEFLPRTVQRILEREWLRDCDRIRLQLQEGEIRDEEALRLAKEYGELRKRPPTFFVPNPTLIS